MTRIYVFCEGQTEETFVNMVLSEHYCNLNIYLTPIVLHTSRTGRGGATSYGKIRRQVDRMCRQDNSAWVTTLLDYYGLPNDFPGMTNLPAVANPIEKARFVQQSFEEDIAQNNFIANLIIHEFEGLLFSSPEAFSCFDSQIVSEIANIRSQFETPEHINNSPITAPSKRILRIRSGYQKITHGSQIAIAATLKLIRQECIHFNSWLTRLEDLAGGEPS